MRRQLVFVVAVAVASLLSVGCGGHKPSRDGGTAVVSGASTATASSSTKAGSIAGQTAAAPRVRVGYPQPDGSVAWAAAQVVDERRPGEFVRAIDVTVPSPPDAANPPRATLFGAAQPAQEVAVRLGRVLSDGSVAWGQPQVVDHRQADGVVRSVDVYVPASFSEPPSASAAPTPTPASATPAPSTPAVGHTAEEAALADRVLALVNQVRADNGLSALLPGDVEQAAAKGHADDMAARGYFSHLSPDGSRVNHRVQRLGGSYRAVGENIAQGQRTAEAVMQSWLSSPGHRAQILDPTHTHLGVGVNLARRLWVQVFTQR